MSHYFKKLQALLMASALTLSLAACGSDTQTSQTTGEGTGTTETKTEETTMETTEAETAEAATDTTEAETVTLKILAQYTSDDEKAVLDYALNAMKEIMPNVEVEIEPATQDGGAKLKTLFATGSLPDIFEVATSDIATAVNSNSVIPLDDYIEKLNIKDQLTPTGQALLEQQDGHTWGIVSANTNFAVIYVNKAVFDQVGAKVPENYEEFLEAGELLKENGIVPLGIWLKEPWPPIQLFDMFALAESENGIAGLDEDGTAKTSDQAYLSAAAKIQEISNKELISKDAFSVDYDTAVADFKNGKTAMLICGNWMAQEFGDTMEDVTLLLPYALADASEAEAVKEAGVMSGGGFTGGYSVAANSEHKDIAAEYAVQLAMKKIEARIVLTGEFNTMLTENITPEKEPNALVNELSEAVSQVHRSSFMAWGFKNSKIYTDLGSEVQKLFTGEYAPEDFAKNMDAVLEKNRQ